MEKSIFSFFLNMADKSLTKEKSRPLSQTAQRADALHRKGCERQEGKNEEARRHRGPSALAPRAFCPFFFGGEGCRLGRGQTGSPRPIKATEASPKKKKGPFFFVGVPRSPVRVCAFSFSRKIATKKTILDKSDESGARFKGGGPCVSFFFLPRGTAWHQFLRKTRRRGRRARGRKARAAKHQIVMEHE